MALNSTIYKWDVLKPLELNFLETVKMISIYKGTTGDCALLVTFSGEIYAVGKSTVGCLGLGHTKETLVPFQLKEITGVEGVHVCGKLGDALAYTKEGKLFTWGDNSDEKYNEILAINSKLLGIFIVNARCANGNYLALCKDGKIYQWRGRSHGGSNLLTCTPTLISVDEIIDDIDCGQFSSLALTQNGEVYWWGKIYNSSSSTALIEHPITKIKITRETVVKVICSCYVHIILTDSGRIFTWGYNRYGLGNSSGSSYSSNYIQVGEKIGRFVDIALNNNNTCAAVTNYGAIFTWGYEGNTTPIFVNFSELHEVFAKYSPSSFWWKKKNSDSINIEGFTGIAKQLKASFNEEENSDLIVKVDNKKIYLHRLILNIRSEYFRTLLQDHWTNKNIRLIELTSFNHDVYKSYFWYLYSGEVKSLVDNLLELWNLANAYNEDNLKLGCEKMMRRNLSFKKLALQHCKAMTKKNYECTSKHENAVERTANLEEKLKLMEINLAKQQQENENLKALLQQQQNADKSS